MPTSHQITCAGDDCPEWSIRTNVHGTHPEWLAEEHRTLLAADGWVDVEGRDYCPGCKPTT